MRDVDRGRLLDPIRRARRYARAAVGRDLGHRPALRLKTERLGSNYGGWNVYTGALSQDSIVYSFGVGNDISFDLDLIARFDMRVHAFDPTPRAVEWIGRQVLPDRFEFHAVGLADFDGVASFRPPPRPDFVSYSLAESENRTESRVSCEVQRLATIMKELQHDRVDLLKLDIEGAEYRALEDILSSGVEVRQLLVEFHHHFADIQLEQTRRAIRQIQRHGLELFYVSPRGEEFSFLRKGMIR